jgi:tRNA(Ser,Leu) C12 N-acetylase TAN1
VGWNVLVTLAGRAYNRPLRLLRRHGRVQQTGLFNVVALEVPDVPAFLEALRLDRDAGGELSGYLARVLPVERSFSFSDAADFADKARGVVLEWAPRLAGRSFHVRIHRRGCKDLLHTLDEERRLDEAVLAELRQRGTPARVTFDDPDAVVDVETLRQEVGMALWTRPDLARYPFVRVD